MEPSPAFTSAMTISVSRIILELLPIIHVLHWYTFHESWEKLEKFTNCTKHLRIVVILGRIGKSFEGTENPLHVSVLGGANFYLFVLDFPSLLLFSQKLRCHPKVIHIHIHKSRLENRTTRTNNSQFVRNRLKQMSQTLLHILKKIS